MLRRDIPLRAVYASIVRYPESRSLILLVRPIHMYLETVESNITKWHEPGHATVERTSVMNTAHGNLVRVKRRNYDRIIVKSLTAEQMARSEVSTAGEPCQILPRLGIRGYSRPSFRGNQ